MSARADAVPAPAVPTLETPRLRLRAYLESDLDAQWAMLSDPTTMHFVGGPFAYREEAWRRMLSSHGLWTMLGYGYWEAERKADGRPIGQVGFGDMKRDMKPSIDGIPEIGWLFAADVAGSGYATEAAAAALSWADEVLRAPETVAIIDAKNMASIRVAEKVGFDVR